jgi:hypothetical protein
MKGSFFGGVNLGPGMGPTSSCASPVWSEEKWQRVAALLGIRWLPSDESAVNDSDESFEAA